MRSSPRLGQPAPPSLSMVLLTGLLIVLWLAGGASRADALGQAVVRGSAWLALATAFLLAPRPVLDGMRPVLFFVLASIMLVIVQLVPLPPSWWLSLPGREPFSGAAFAIGGAQPWRPLAIVPDAAWNALSTLVVPLTVLLLLAGIRPRERAWVPGILLGLVAASALLGLLQFAGAAVANPFVNERAGEVSGSLANRNHFALFTAIGCILVPAWVFLDGRRPNWRGPVGAALVLFFTLIILASGSRAGILAGALALGLSALIARQGIRRTLRHAPRWVLPAGVALLVIIATGAVLVAVAAGRAPSIDRVFAVDTGEDMRFRALPTVLTMVRAYFPFGAGFGGFDPLFRQHEPFSLLKPTYFNHAHDDLLEVVIEGGVAALALLVLAVVWWLRASVRAWRNGAALAKAGSAVILLILVGSAFDYPTRTPLVMATLVIAAAWLGMSATLQATAALPAERR